MRSFDGHQFRWQISSLQEHASIKSFLQEQQFSRRALANLKASGIILVNGEAVTIGYWLQVNDVLEIRLPEVVSAQLVGTDGPITILYEDTYILIVNKPAGLLCIPSRVKTEDSLAQRILGYYQKQGIPSTIHVLTRLDKDTSGAVLIAKDRYTQSRLHSEKIERYYHAVVSGVPDELFSIDQPIAKCKDSIIKREVQGDGQVAQTFGKRLATNGAYSLIELQLATGRTHQIRVHMNWAGFSLIGDTMYGGELVAGIERQALHAKRLVFTHPYTKKEIVIDCPYPQDFDQLVTMYFNVNNKK